jgi:hypothetical protein
MVKITVNSGHEAAETARTIVRAANIVPDAPGLSCMEQRALIYDLCALRDAITVEEPEKEAT